MRVHIDKRKTEGWLKIAAQDKTNVKDEEMREEY